MYNSYILSGVKEKHRFGGQRESTAGRSLALHKVDPTLIQSMNTKRSDLYTCQE